MAHQTGEDVYATLLLSDNYLPGALVLAHSLRDAGSSKKLAVLVTLDTVSAEVVTQLKTVYDYVLPVPRIKNDAAPGNLALMNRPDLHSAFTKINLWKQLQFRKIVYIDADVVAYRAPDELFDLPHAFAAAPDIGWPDLFNTGVMVVTPDLGEFYALSAMAQRGISFDGADQGLLNMHFKNTYHRLPFTYNVTPSAHYQYLPAYRHFQSSISMVHFIGSDKPWFQGRSASTGGGAYDEMVGQWWAVYDRHYRAATPPAPESGLSAPPPPPVLVQYFVKGEYNPTVSYKLTADGLPLDLGRSTHGQHSGTLPPPPPQPFLAHPGGHEPSPAQHHLHGGQQPQEHALAEDALPSSSPPSTSLDNLDANTNTETPLDQDHGHGAGTSYPPASEHKNEYSRPPMEPSWDAQWQPPPANARPEAMNFPQAHYEMSRDTTPFIPPQRYPSPPRDLWYEVPRGAHKPTSIFPWETNQPAPTRVFADPPPPSEPSTFLGSSSVDLETEPATPTTASGTRREPPSSADPWANFTRSNAWDGVPQIERYVDAFQKQHGRTKSRGQAPGPGGGGGAHAGRGGGLDDGAGDGADAYASPSSPAWRRGSKVTDFPSEVERPSLPVTPAPIRRSTHWGADDVAVDARGERLLPAAQGVPQQADWDPATQLQKLAKEQSRLLLDKLGQGQLQLQQEHGGGGDETPTATVTIPLRPLPLGSDGIRSPTYVAQAPAVVMSPTPVKPGGLQTSSVRSIYDQSSGESSAIDAPTPEDAKMSTEIAQASYLGPGIMFEKDEGVPAHGMTAALPSEEELDVLAT